ncbi:MAG: DinB family protein [Terriglobales bacterium]
MSIAQTLLNEFEVQVPITRRYLERLPEDKLAWKPHPKSLSAGALAFHLAYVPGRTAEFVRTNPAPAPDFSFPEPDSVAQVLASCDQHAGMVRAILPQFSDADMNAVWRMVAGERELVAMPRGLFLRNIMLSHWYQHRGQFAVYLRLLEVPVPASWGPSADEGFVPV